MSSPHIVLLISPSSLSCILHQDVPERAYPPALQCRASRKDLCVTTQLVAISDLIAAYLPRGRQMVSKVPEVTIFFWMIKILATTVGETGADFLTHRLHWGLFNTTYVMTGLLLITLFFQFRLRGY